MKKKLAILLAAVMVAAMVPVSAFASSANRLVDNVKTVKKDTVTTSKIAIKDDKNDLYTYNNGNNIVFEVTLSNAKFATPANADIDATLGDVTGSAVVNSETSATITVLSGQFTDGNQDELIFDFDTKVKENGEASITINPVNGGISGGTYTYAIAASGSTSTTIEDKVTLSESGVALKPISIIETAPGSFEDGTVKLKLSKNFEYVNNGTLSVAYGDGTIVTPGALAAGTADDTIQFTISGAPSSAVTKLIISGIQIQGDDADDGDVAEITISGGGVTKTTLEVGTYAEFGYTLTVEDKDLPVFYSGSYDDNETLKVTFKETVTDSWAATRKTTFTFPEGIKVLSVDVKDVNSTTNLNTSYDTTDPELDENKVTFSNVTNSAKAKIEFKFELSVSPEFTGDITCTVGGSAVDEDQEVVIATAEMPFTVEVETNEVNIDYRNVEVGDITIKEAYEGALKDGTTLELQAENMDFEKGFKWEVTEGDLEIDDITISGGNITIEIDSESAKTPGTIVISDLSLYLDRTLPAGDYGLSVVNSDTSFDLATSAGVVTGTASDDAFFKNFDTDDHNPGFDIDEVEVAKAYVKVVTAGRDQDDSTFTTQIVVPIGAYEIKAGTKTVALDTPAYINEAGYTMMPLRGVVEALSGSAIISWDDATKTATILFGTRVISMTIGTKSMIINGTAIAMTSAPVIVNSRTFLPLRDLGYALGLSDNKIAWDDTTKTATLN